MAVVFQENVHFYKFTIKDTMELTAHIYGEQLSEHKMITILKQMGLENRINQRADKLSGGQLRRLNLAMSMIKENP